MVSDLALVQIFHHQAIDHGYSTVFLHEDILARTLFYELDLQQWRQAEVAAGRTDPGRPSYADVSSESSPCHVSIMLLHY